MSQKIPSLNFVWKKQKKISSFELYLGKQKNLIFELYKKKTEKNVIFEAKLSNLREQSRLCLFNPTAREDR